MRKGMHKPSVLILWTLILAASFISTGYGADTDSLVVSDNGNVGIGTASPAGKLTIQGAEPHLRIQSEGNRAVFQLAPQQGQGWDIGVGHMNSSTNEDFWIGDYTRYRMVLKKGAPYLGLCEDNPMRNLHLTSPTGSNEMIMEVTDGAPNHRKMEFCRGWWCRRAAKFLYPKIK